MNSREIQKEKDRLREAAHTAIIKQQTAEAERDQARTHAAALHAVIDALRDERDAALKAAAEATARATRYAETADRAESERDTADAIIDTLNKLIEKMSARLNEMKEKADTDAETIADLRQRAHDTPDDDEMTEIIDNIHDEIFNNPENSEIVLNNIREILDDWTEPATTDTTESEDI